MQSLEAIADPTRRRIIEMLAKRDCAVGEIVAEFAMTPPAISQHLKVLREAGLVTTRTVGQSRIQSLNPAGLAEIGQWLQQTMHFWNLRLDALEAALLADDAKAPQKTGATSQTTPPTAESEPSKIPPTQTQKTTS